MISPQDGFNGIYIVNEAAVFDGGFDDKGRERGDAQGRTYLSHENDNIVEADIVINGTMNFFNDVDPQGSDRAKVDIVSLMMHEFTHALGIEHIEHDEVDGIAINSLMASMLGDGVVRREIGDILVESLSCEY